MVAVIFVSTGACKSSDTVNNLINSINPSSSPAPFSLNSVVPSRTGPGAKVKLVGTGFQSGATVEVGGITAEVLSVSSTEILVKTPDLPQGDASVKVVNPNGSESELSGNTLHISWVTHVSASSTHTCAVINSAEIQCWGINTNGELGNGVELDQTPAINTNIIQSSPVKVVGITGVVSAVSSGYNHSCAIVDGGIKCWGGNSTGQLGNNPTNFINLSTPVAVVGIANASSISAGYAQTCAVSGGKGYCWGSGGGLGTGSDDSSFYPVQVFGFDSDVTSLSTSNLGSYFTCGIKAGALYCWGSNGNGGLGNGEIITIETPVEMPGTISSNTPILIPGMESGVSDLAIANNNACATVGGSFKCWGFNGYYQLANGSNSDAFFPKPTSALPSVPSYLGIGTGAPCGIFGAGVKCWGPNGSGGLGNGSANTTVSQTPVDVIGLTSGVQKISVGDGGSTCAIKNGGLYCWGQNTNGTIGNGTTVDSFTPVVPNIIW